MEEKVAGEKEEDKEEELDLMPKRKAKELEDKVAGEKEEDKEEVPYKTRRSKRLMSNK